MDNWEEIGYKSQLLQTPQVPRKDVYEGKIEGISLDEYLNLMEGFFMKQLNRNGAKDNVKAVGFKLHYNVNGIFQFGKPLVDELAKRNIKVI